MPKVTHGHSGTSLYKTWERMRQRCHNPNSNSYGNYGGRGIVVCERWLSSFENFLADMGERPEGKTLDRYPDNDGNYEPGNCRWATNAEQKRNTRRTKMITFNGKTLCMRDWAALVGVSESQFWKRINKGWPLERALTPSDKRFAHPPGGK